MCVCCVCVCVYSVCCLVDTLCRFNGMPQIVSGTISDLPSVAPPLAAAHIRETLPRLRVVACARSLSMWIIRWGGVW